MSGTSIGLLGEVEHFDVDDAASGRGFRIFVSKPALPAPPNGYRTLYITDANLLFGTVVEQAMLRSVTGELDPAIIVGIGYRTPDPTTALTERMVDFGNGGRAALHRFLIEQVIPLVEPKYPLDARRRSIFGFSLGGLFALEAYLNTADVFEAVIAASPSIWFDEPSVGGQPPSMRTRLLVTAGELEESTDDVAAPPNMDRAQAVALVERAAMIAKARAFVARIRDGGATASDFQLLAGESHSSAPAASIARALRFALSPSQVRAAISPAGTG